MPPANFAITYDVREPWYFACRRVNHEPSSPQRQFIAWAARKPNLGSGPCCEELQNEPTAYAFGASEETALADCRGKV